MQIKLNINDRAKELEAKPHEFLVEVLRRNGYLGAKKGCETGNCGLCTVLVDDKPVLSCSYLAVRAEGKKITTIEGVQERATEIGSFLVEEGAEQCGFCSPGLIMAVIGLEKEIELNENKTIKKEDIQHYLTNNLCRCTGYVGQIRAINKYMGVE